MRFRQAEIRRINATDVLCRTCGATFKPRGSSPRTG